jgi:hypothetical protein
VLSPIVELVEIVEIDAQAGAGTDAVIGSGDRRLPRTVLRGIWIVHVVV